LVNVFVDVESDKIKRHFLSLTLYFWIRIWRWWNGTSRDNMMVVHAKKKGT